MSDLNGIKGFIKSEKDGIEELLQSVDDRTERVINVLAECKGKVVFMGVGKSAHIGQKLAATFASTGTPRNVKSRTILDLHLLRRLP